MTSIGRLKRTQTVSLPGGSAEDDVRIIAPQYPELAAALHDLYRHKDDSKRALIDAIEQLQDVLHMTKRTTDRVTSQLARSPFDCGLSNLSSSLAKLRIAVDQL